MPKKVLKKSLENNSKQNKTYFSFAYIFVRHLHYFITDNKKQNSSQISIQLEVKIKYTVVEYTS